MLLNRDEFVSALFRETDRAQRMKCRLALVYFGIEQTEGPSQPDSRTFMSVVDEIVGGITQILRCYDSVGRMGPAEFAMLLPGCTSPDAMALAHRLKQKEFAAPVLVDGTEMRLAACFGVTASKGRSAFIVLREAEQAFRLARARGAGSIQCSMTEKDTGPESFLRAHLAS